MKFTASQKELLQEVLARFNQRRTQRGRSRVTAQDLPPAPHELDRIYLVDTFTVRRHWRRKPIRHV